MPGSFQDPQPLTAESPYELQQISAVMYDPAKPFGHVT
jgi:hypothetical protein